MSQTTRTYIINAKEVKSGKSTFLVYSTKIGENWFKIKFRQDVQNVPRKAGVYRLFVDILSLGLQNGSWYIDKEGQKKQGNDIIWVRKIDKIEELTKEELDEMNLERLKSALGEIEDKDLPF